MKRPSRLVLPFAKPSKTATKSYNAYGHEYALSDISKHIDLKSLTEEEASNLVAKLIWPKAELALGYFSAFPTDHFFLKLRREDSTTNKKLSCLLIADEGLDKVVTDALNAELSRRAAEAEAKETAGRR